MAKLSKGMFFKNAVINLNDMTLIEFTKDDSAEYSLKSILQHWDGIEGVTLTIKKDSEFQSDIGEDE